MNRNAKRAFCSFYVVISAAAILAGTVLTGCSRADDLCRNRQNRRTNALTVFTAQEPEEWEPVIKEFEERTGWNVKVETGSAKEMLSAEKEEADWDVAFGVSDGCFEEGKEYWQAGKDAWTGYSTVSFVILYNTNVVTYRVANWMGQLIRTTMERPCGSASDPLKSIHVCSQRRQNSEKEEFLDL